VLKNSNFPETGIAHEDFPLSLSSVEDMFARKGLRGEVLREYDSQPGSSGD